MFFLPVNGWTMFAAITLTMIIGFLWYSPVLFGNTRHKKIVQKSGRHTKNLSMAYALTLNIGTSILMIYILAQIQRLMLVSSAAEGATTGLFVWLGFVAVAYAQSVLRDTRQMNSALIHSGYFLITLVLSGALLGHFI